MNINEYVKVRLTESGYSIYDTYCFRRYQIVAPRLEEHKFKLVELMQIFGPGLFTGVKSFFIDDEVVRIKQGTSTSQLTNVVLPGQSLNE